jgi:hypothetical protein
LKLAYQFCLRFQGLSHHHESSGVAVEPMDDAGSRKVSQVRKVRQQSIEQGPTWVAGCGMHHEARGLIDHQQICILKHHIQRHRLCKPVSLGLWLGGLHPDLLMESQGLAWTHRFIVDAHTALLDPALEARARLIGIPQSEYAIQALADRLCIDPEYLGLAIIGALVT